MNRKISFFLCNNWQIILILVLAVAVRLIGLDATPAGMNQDECFHAYESFSLANYGMDSYGYRYPIYFMSWGSGESALYAYITIPFVKLFGLNVFVIRLPQAIMGSLTVLAAYCIGKKMISRKFALIFMFLLAINPWHIMLSRFGLSCNPLPFFLLIGLLFWIKGMENDRYLILSAVFYGLSLYCYATIWTILPIILLLQAVYGIYCGKIKLTKSVVASLITLGVIALPLLLFLLINVFGVSEIRTSFFSIPKLLYFRGGDFDASKLLENLLIFYKIMTAQGDGTLFNSLPGFGLYYMFSMPIIIIGLVMLFNNLRHSKIIIGNSGEKTICYQPQLFVIFNLLSAIPTILLVQPNINRINYIHIPLIFCCAYGIYVIQKKFINSLAVLIAIYTFSFLGFAATYFTHEYQGFNYGYHDAVQYSLTIPNKTIYFSDMSFSTVLFETAIPTPEYISTVKFENYPSAWISAKSFGRYSMSPDVNKIDFNGVYVCNAENVEMISMLTEHNFMIQQLDRFIIAEVSK